MDLTRMGENAGASVSIFPYADDVQMKIWDGSNSEVAEQEKKFIDLIPGVSVIIFFAALFGVAKKYFLEAGFPVDFIFGLIGSSGQMKTTLIRHYALWSRNDFEQITPFLGERNTQARMVEMISEWGGHNVLADDLHHVHQTSLKNRVMDTLDSIVRYVGRNQDAANVFCTAESTEMFGIFSVRDRIMQISLPAMDSASLSDLKSSVSDLDYGYMSFVADRFRNVLADRGEEVALNIKNHFQNSQIAGDMMFRRAYMDMFLISTAKLYFLYLHEGEDQRNVIDALEKALGASRIKQEKSMRAVLEKGDGDILVSLYRFFDDAGKSTGVFPVSDIKKYFPSEWQYFTKNGHIYITNEALVGGMMSFLEKVVSLKEISDAMCHAGIIETSGKDRTQTWNGKRHYIIIWSLLKRYYDIKNSESQL